MATGRIHNFAFFLLTFYFLKLFNQFESIMQNKPNLLNAQMNVNTVITEDYENERLRRAGKTNPIQTQNKANTNPIPEMSKMKLNFYSTKGYEDKPPSHSAKTNPIQTQSNPISKAASTHSPSQAQILEFTSKIV